jgi:hypothetical protein
VDLQPEHLDLHRRRRAGHHARRRRPALRPRARRPSSGAGGQLDISNVGDDDPSNDIVWLRTTYKTVWAYTSSGWINTGGLLNTIAAGDDQLFGIDTSGKILRYRPFGEGAGWTDSGKIGVALWVTNTGDGIAANDLVFAELSGFDVQVWDQLLWSDTAADIGV